MNLIQLTYEAIKNFKAKDICCIEKNQSCLDELCEKYGILQQITCIIDENPRNCGAFYYDGREIQVYPLEHLKNLDLAETVVLITSDYYRECFRKIEDLLESSNAPSVIYFFANKETEYELSYRKQYETEPLQDIIVFRSGPHASAYVEGMSDYGLDFADNARALFEYMLSAGLNRRYEFVWLVNNPAGYDKRYASYDNIVFLPYSGSVSEEITVRDNYYRVLCLAKYFFFTDAYGFVRNCRNDQIRVQLWHGCGFKKRLNHVSCEYRYEYMPVTSELYARLHALEFGLRPDQMLVTGLPKADWLFEKNEGILERAGIPDAEKYIFWLPTYRFSVRSSTKPVDGRLNLHTGLPLLSTDDEFDRLNRMLAGKNIVLVIKPHPFQDSSVIHVKGYSNIMLLDNRFLFEKEIQINQILGFADSLISDYSSAAVDYLALNRPMAFIADDIEEYENRRGFIFNDLEEWLPGDLISSFDDLMYFVDGVAQGEDYSKNKREVILKKFHQYPCAGSCKRLLEALKITG